MNASSGKFLLNRAVAMWQEKLQDWQRLACMFVRDKGKRYPSNKTASMIRHDSPQACGVLCKVQISAGVVSVPQKEEVIRGRVDSFVHSKHRHQSNVSQAK